MQNPKFQYLLKQNQESYLFLLNGKKLLFRHAGQFSAPLAEDVLTYHATFYQGEILITCLRENGSLTLFRQNNGGFMEISLAEGGRLSSVSALYGKIEGDVFHLFYTVSAQNGIDQLYYWQKRTDAWQKPILLDRLLPMGSVPFFAHTLGASHLILYYRTAKNILCAREVLLSPFTLGSLKTILTAPGPFGDLSIFSETDCIHALCLVRGLFSNQLHYCCKNNDNTCPTKIVREESGMEHCLLFPENGRVSLYWKNQSRAFRLSSLDGGMTFQPAESCFSLPASTIKIPYLKENGQTGEVFADSRTGDLLLPLQAPVMMTRPVEPATVSFAPKADISLQIQSEMDSLKKLLQERSDEVSRLNAMHYAQIHRLENELEQAKAELQRLQTREQTPCTAVESTPAAPVETEPTLEAAEPSE